MHEKKLTVQELKELLNKCDKLWDDSMIIFQTKEHIYNIAIFNYYPDHPELGIEIVLRQKEFIGGNT